MVSASTQPQIGTKKLSFAEGEMVAPSAGLRNLRRRAHKPQRSGPAESDPDSDSDSDSDSRSEPKAGDTECGEAWKKLEKLVLTSLPNDGLREACVYAQKSKNSRKAVKSNKSSSVFVGAKPALADAESALARAPRKPSQIQTKKDWEFLRSAEDGAAEDAITWTHLRSRSEYSSRVGFDGN